MVNQLLYVKHLHSMINVKSGRQQFPFLTVRWLREMLNSREKLMYEFTSLPF